GHALDLGLAAELAFGADFTGHTGHFGGEGTELVHHRVDGVFQFQDFALHIDGDLLGQVAGGDGGGHFGNITHLSGEVAGHEVNGVGKIFPGAGDALHLRLAAQDAFGAHFAGHARHFRREGGQLIDHDVDDVLDLQNFAANIDGDLLRQVAAGNGGGDLGNVAE